MNKIKFLILAFAVNLISFGQINTEADLIGKWAVNEIWKTKEGTKSS